MHRIALERGEEVVYWNGCNFTLNVKASRIYSRQEAESLIRSMREESIGAYLVEGDGAYRVEHEIERKKHFMTGTGWTVDISKAKTFDKGVALSIIEELQEDEHIFAYLA